MLVLYSSIGHRDANRALLQPFVWCLMDSSRVNACYTTRTFEWYISYLDLICVLTMQLIVNHTQLRCWPSVVQPFKDLGTGSTSANENLLLVLLITVYGKKVFKKREKNSIICQWNSSTQIVFIWTHTEWCWFLPPLSHRTLMVQRTLGGLYDIRNIDF